MVGANILEIVSTKMRSVQKCEKMNEKGFAMGVTIQGCEIKASRVGANE